VQVIAFYTGTVPDHRGRFLNEIHEFSQDQLELNHDYIQWLFPLDTPSRFNPMAPCLTQPEIAQFHESPVLQQRLISSFGKMLGFFGFSLSEERGDPSIVKAHDFKTRKAIWLKSGNHNCLRISRMLRSLCLLGLPAYSQAFMDALCQLGWFDRWRLGSETYRRWQQNLR
jgi:hypothetical protein